MDVVGGAAGAGVALLVHGGTVTFHVTSWAVIADHSGRVGEATITSGFLKHLVLEYVKYLWI